MDQMTESQLEILCRISGAKTLQKIVDFGYELIGNPVFIADMSHVMLAYTRAVDIPDEDWQRTVVNGDITSNVSKADRGGFNAQRKQAHDASVSNRMPALIADDDKPYPRLVKVLLSDGQKIGVMVSPAIFKPFTDTDIKLLELLSSFAISVTRDSRYRFTQNERSIENYLIHILDGANYTALQVKERMDYLDWKPLTYFYIMAARPVESRDSNSNSLVSLLNELPSRPTCCAFPYENFVVMIYSTEKSVTSWPEESPWLDELLRRLRLKAGVSRRFEGLADLKRHYWDAAAALNISTQLESQGQFFSYNTYSIYDLFNEAISHINLRDYCHEKILDLEKYDLANRGSLLVTLHLYLEHTKSLAKTAELLFVHRNTVLYRIKKCMEIMNTDLEDVSENFSFVFSLKILEFEAKMLRNSLLRGLIP